MTVLTLRRYDLVRLTVTSYPYRVGIPLKSPLIDRWVELINIFDMLDGANITAG